MLYWSFWGGAVLLKDAWVSNSTLLRSQDFLNFSCRNVDNIHDGSGWCHTTDFSVFQNRTTLALQKLKILTSGRIMSNRILRPYCDGAMAGCFKLEAETFIFNSLEELNSITFFLSFSLFCPSSFQFPIQLESPILFYFLFILQHFSLFNSTQLFSSLLVTLYNLRDKKKNKKTSRETNWPLHPLSSWW